VDAPCTFSIIIPVFHEETLIHPLIEKLYRQFSNELFEIIVVDGDPDGSTTRWIQHPDVVTASSQLGRGAQMNAGARLARGEILIFLHADTELPANAFQHILQVLADSRYVAGAFKLALDSDRWLFKLIARTASWRYHLTQLPYGDQAFFMPKDYFFRIGGFKEIPIMEDIDLMRRIKKRKEKVHISPSTSVTTSVRRWQQEGILYAVVRGWVLASLYCLGASPDKLAKYYRSHG
jgi:rSAM/selenodomain-associated transferase 2